MKTEDYDSATPPPASDATVYRKCKHLPFPVPRAAADLLDAAPSVIVANSAEELVELATRDADENGWHEVSYDVPGKGAVLEARVCANSNGISANYEEAYMRRRDPDCMVIGDDRPTDKAKYTDRFGEKFFPVRDETLEWMATQPLAVFAFQAGMDGKGANALAIVPDNAGFFALGLALLQGILDLEKLPEDFCPHAVVYVAPPFRHSHFEGEQVVVHNRRQGLHELFSYNLYPGPSAKKGIYGVLLNIGVKERWITMHCSTVKVVTPYDNAIVITHEGASGGGKSEMLEHVHRQRDGSIKFARHLFTDEEIILTLPQACDLFPVTDDMALCHPSLEKGRGKLTLQDAEDAWFVRVNHIVQYGVDPDLEKLTISPPKPLLFLNIKASPNATTLIWEHIEDEPGSPCPNPRVVVPRDIVGNIVKGSVDVDIRSMGVRTPPCTAENPTYGILGIMHILPPALAWLWRLVAPRGHANPSILDTQGMSSEGVGSYWPFATGRRVDHANLLLRQIKETPLVKYILLPNQNIGAWEVSFMPQWIMREYLARRGHARFQEDQVVGSRCSLLGYSPKRILVEGKTIASRFFRVEEQPEVGIEAYDQGANQLSSFFKSELQQFLVPDIDEDASKIIECCLNDGTIEDYENLLDIPTLEKEI